MMYKTKALFQPKIFSKDFITSLIVKQKTSKQIMVLNFKTYFKKRLKNWKNQRFNPTLKEEFLDFGNFHPDSEVFNPRPLNWLEEFIYLRPHQALSCKTPIEVAAGSPQLSKMYLSDTVT